jgi:hypothetical protein
MQLKIYNKHKTVIALGIFIGVIAGYFLSGFFIYMGLLFIPLFLLIALFERNIKRKLLLWAFIASCTPSALITWIYILPYLTQK